MTLTKVKETSDACVYAFGSADTSVGRARVDKSTGDVELLELEETEEHPREQFYLAHVVPQLQRFHEQNTYPDEEDWAA